MKATISRSLHFVTLALILVLLLSIPLLRNAYLITLLSTLFLYITLAESWNLLAGYAGQFSMGHAGFFGVAGASSTFLLLFSGIPAYLCVIAGGITAMALATTLSFPFFRLRGAYFAFVTLGMAEIVKTMLSSSAELGGTGGTYLPLRLDENTSYYLLMLLSLATIVILYKIVGSKFGIGLVSIREDEDAAEVLGIPVFRYKVAAFALSSFFAGLAGSIYSSSLSYYNVFGFFDLTWTLRAVVMVMVGGIGTITGPIIGAVILVFLYDWLLALPFWSLIVVGAILIFVSIFAGKGIMGELLKLPKLKSLLRRIEKRV